MQHRFLALDGLRGIAAFVILIYHFAIRPAWVAPYGSLAVDFFFLLSGFVIAHAYEERLKQPGAIGAFIRDRVIRLHPLLLLSIIPGAILTLIGGQISDPLPWLTVITAGIPLPAVWKAGLWMFGFPLNMPSWSLFWELVVNLLFAVTAPYLSTRRLVIALIPLILAAIATQVSLQGSDGHLAIAGLRALSAFPLGVLLLRIHRSGRVRLGQIGVLAAPLLFLSLMVPGPFPMLRIELMRFGLFPLIVLAAADREVRFPAACAFLGGMSYPLYILHNPLMMLLRKFIFGRENGSLVTDLIVGSLVLLLVWLIWRFYDEPVRAWLRRRYGSRAHRAPSA